MAHTTANTTSIPAVFGVVADILSGIFGALLHLNEASAKVRKIEALSALSDADLSARGVERADIIRRVMSDTL